MVITLIMDQYGQGNNGTTMTAMRFAEVLRKHGHTVKVITANRIDEDNVYAVGERNVPILKQVGRSQGMCFAKPDKKILYEVIKESDVVHSFLPFKIQKVGKKIADELGVASTAAFHCQPENITSTIYMNKFKPVNKYIYRKFRKFFNKFGHVHCPSEMIKNQLLENKYTSQLHVISNGVSESFVKRPSVKPKELEGKYIILMVGRFSREKRQDLIIEAVLKSKYEDKIQIVLAGKGPWKKHLESIGSKLTNKIVFGFYNQEELIDVINYSDLYVHASDAEIEAISCMEAFTCGAVPIISNSKISATNQFALDEHNLFEAGNSDSLRKQIEFWYEHPQLKAEFSDKYIEYAKRYQLDNCVTELEKVFELAIKENAEKLAKQSK